MATGTIDVPQKYIFEEVTVASSQSISSGTGTDYTASASKTGYIPVGIVSVRKTGASFAYTTISGFYIDSNEDIHVAIYNGSTATRTINVYALVMYQKV